MALVDKYPKDPRAHLFRGLYLLEQRDVTGAEPYFRDVVRLGECQPGHDAANCMTGIWRCWLSRFISSIATKRPRTSRRPLCANTSQLDERTRETLDQAQVCAP